MKNVNLPSPKFAHYSWLWHGKSTKWPVPYLFGVRERKSRSNLCYLVGLSPHDFIFLLFIGQSICCNHAKLAVTTRPRWKKTGYSFSKNYLYNESEFIQFSICKFVIVGGNCAEGVSRSPILCVLQLMALKATVYEPESKLTKVGSTASMQELTEASQ